VYDSDAMPRAILAILLTLIFAPAARPAETRADSALLAAVAKALPQGIAVARIFHGEPIDVSCDTTGLPAAPPEPTRRKKNPHAVALGRLGGKVKSPAKARPSDVARKAAMVRWAKK
jgi:hypothetical protein